MSSQGESLELISTSSDSRKEPIPVEIRFTINSINSINTVEETFQCNFYMEAAWRNPTLIKKEWVDNMGKDATLNDYAEHLVKEGTISKKTELVEIPQKSVWYPRMILANAQVTDDVSQYSSFAVRWEEENGSFIPKAVQKSRKRGTFSQKMNMKLFPFDEQKLKIVLQCNRPSTEIILKPDNKYPSVLDAKKVYGQEWIIESDLKVECRESDPSSSGKKTTKSEFHLSISVERKSETYFWNTFFILGLIGLIAFATFLVPPEDIADRLSVILTLFLTAVAFKFVVSSSIPKIPYLTVLDYYVIASFTMLFLISFENSLVGLLRRMETLGHDSSIIIDIVSAIGLFVAFVLLHIGLLVFVKIKHRMKQSTNTIHV